MNKLQNLNSGRSSALGVLGGTLAIENSLSYLTIILGICLIISSIFFKYILAEKYCREYKNPHKYINLTYSLLFILGISCIIIGLLALYTSHFKFLKLILLISLICLIVPQLIDGKYGCKK